RRPRGHGLRRPRSRPRTSWPDPALGGQDGSMTIPSVPLGGPVDMPLLGFGPWQIRGAAAYEAVREALEAGYRHLDTATMYGNEAEVGRALRDRGVPRDEVCVTTKLRPDRAGRERATLDASLAALGVE